MSEHGKIAFQGELGANSDEACRAYFPRLEPKPCATFEDAFEAVKSGDCALGMIPVENSIAGRVGDVHHLLPDSGLKIIGERFKPIRFQLMANPGARLEDIKTVASMPIALGQCRKVLRKLGVRTEQAGDTAGAAKSLAEHPDPTRAAIAPTLAAEIYGLNILMGDVEDERQTVLDAHATLAHRPRGADDLFRRFAFRRERGKQRAGSNGRDRLIHDAADHARGIFSGKIVPRDHGTQQLRKVVHLPALARKLRANCAPAGVRIDSGWNCTPAIGSVRCATP